MELYNLREDISEKNNLAKSMQDKVDTLKARMDALHKSIMDEHRPRGTFKP